MKLTPKQEKFAQGVASGMSRVDAYRAAYDCSGMKDSTVHRNAFTAMQNSKIVARVEELQKPVIEAVQLTLEEHLAELKALRDGAKNKEDFGSAIKAETKRGEACGFYKQKTEAKLDANIVFGWEK